MYTKTYTIAKGFYAVRLIDKGTRQSKDKLVSPPALALVIEYDEDKIKSLINSINELDNDNKLDALGAWIECPFNTSLYITDCLNGYRKELLLDLRFDAVDHIKEKGNATAISNIKMFVSSSALQFRFEYNGRLIKTPLFNYHLSTLKTSIFINSSLTVVTKNDLPQ